MIQLKLISVEYFMDKMEDWEMLEIVSYVEYSHCTEWEIARLMLSCHVDHKKVKKLTDIMQFPWDKEYVKTELKKTITQEEIDRMKARAKEISKYM